MVEEPQENGGTIKPKGPSIWKRLGDKLGINLPIVLLMAKGAVAPTIGLAIYQNSSVAERFSTIGYLIPIMSILTVPIMPRARYIQNFLVTALLICFAAAISLFAMWCAVKARENTTHISKVPDANGPVPGARVSPYNPAASAVMAVWFFFWVWMANTFRAYRPQYFLPSIVFSVFINVTGTYGTQFATMEQAEALVSRLLETFFAGFGISFAVNLLIIPFTSRNIVSMLITQELNALKSVIEVQSQYILSLPTRDWYEGSDVSNGLENGTADKNSSLPKSTPWPEAATLKRATQQVTELHVKIQSEIRYAKREADWAKLDAKDFQKIAELLKDILVPVLGLESFTQVTDRIEKNGGWAAMRMPNADHGLTESELKALEDKEKEQWKWIFEQIGDPIRILQQGLIEGLDYALYTLEFAKRPASAKTDLEANNKRISPRLEVLVQDFLRHREVYLKEWCASKGMDDSSERTGVKPAEYPLHERHQSQLYLVLDLEYSFLMAAKAILDLVRFAESKVEDGSLAKKRFIFPNWNRIKKWTIAAFTREDSNLDYQSYSTRSGTVTVHITDAIEEKDAEHLPPVTVYEKVTDKFRVIPKFFGSPESAFGFRVACATMCISVTCYLRNSQHFFIEQRIIWGSIMVAISMTQTAGSGIYGQFLRFGGTAVAMVVSFVVWYVPDQHTAGIIVFVGLAMFFYHYTLIKDPTNPVVPMIGMVTVMLIVGYELQVKQIGILISISNGQIYHPVYIIAPYRLAAVAGGVFVAFLFTYFPSVVTARSQLRKDLGSSLYLLGNYCSSVQQTVELGILDIAGDPLNKKSPGRLLQKSRVRVFAKELVLLQGMQQHVNFTSWEPTFGGRFPRESYEKLIQHTTNIIHFTTLIAYVTETFHSLPTQPDGQRTSDTLWLKDFKELIASLELTSHNVTSLLSIVAASISSSRPLPPYLKAPESVRLGQLLSRMDANILSATHVCEPGYAAFAVMQVSAMMLGDDLEGMLEETRKLVGEVKFNIDIVRMEDLEADVQILDTKDMKRD